MASNLNKEPSLFIPSVLEDLATDEGIRHYLQRFGHINTVNIVPTSKKGVYKAFVHFNEWYNDEYAQNWKMKVMNSTVRAELNIGNGFFLLLPQQKSFPDKFEFGLSLVDMLDDLTDIDDSI